MGTFGVTGSDWGVVFLTVPLISFLLDSLSFWIKVSSASSSGHFFSTSALTTYLWSCERRTVSTRRFYHNSAKAGAASQGGTKVHKHGLWRSKTRFFYFFRFKIVFWGERKSHDVKNTRGFCFFFNWKENCKVQLQWDEERSFFCLAYASFCPLWQQRKRGGRGCVGQQDNIRGGNSHIHYMTI